MKDMELLASIIAAAGHDVGHPALTNRYIVTTRDPMAIVCEVYVDNDISVLEMMHCSMTFQVLSETKLLSALSQESWELVRKVAIEMILATDMSKHFDLLGVFRGLSITDVTLQTFEERLVLFKMAIKCADIGHAAKETSLHERWTERIIEEFFAQGDREKQSSLTVSMYCDRETTDVCKSQIGFITVIVLPLFEVTNACLKSDSIEEDCIEQLRRNIDFWRAKSVKRRSSLVADTAATVPTDHEEVRLVHRAKTSARD